MLTSLDYGPWRDAILRFTAVAARWLEWFVHAYREEIIAVFTVVLALATFSLWRATHNLVRGSERTAQTQLRAYISLESGSIQHANIDGQLGFIVSVVLRNYGVTPGYHFRTWMSPPAILDAEVVPFAAPAVSIADGASSILGPGSQAHLNWRAVFPPDALPEIRDGKKAIFCWGGANYTDAFGHQRHFTFRCATSGGEDTADQGGWGLKPHKIGYDAN